uniref:Uncharacterized protein n=1 Tax=Glossina austeni TaxID=7395 RepID=A0A1A9VYI6_GLOAU
MKLFTVEFCDWFTLGGKTIYRMHRSALAKQMEFYKCNASSPERLLIAREELENCRVTKYTIISSSKQTYGQSGMALITNMFYVFVVITESNHSWGLSSDLVCLMLTHVKRSEREKEF